MSTINAGMAAASAMQTQQAVQTKIVKMASEQEQAMVKMIEDSVANGKALAGPGQGGKVDFTA